MPKITYTSPVHPRQVGDAVKMMRESKNLTGAALGAEIGLPQGRISQIESGRSTDLFKQLSEIARVCGYRFVITFEEDDQKK